MKLLILGAGGKTGRLVVAAAVRAGHDVTALVREPASFDGAVRVVVGDATDTAAVTGALAGQAAVIDAIGGKVPYRDTGVETATARVLVEAMRATGVRRLIAVSALGIGDSGDHAPFWYEHVLLPTMLRGVRADKGGMERTVTGAPDLDVTLVRPGLLSDAADAPPLRVITGDDKASSTTRADLARFLVEQVESDRYVGQAVVVANS